jgi:hypothetical protein
VTSKPETITPDLAKTVERLGALLPQIAASLGIAVASTNHAPKPLRAVRPPAKKLPPKPPTAPKAAPVATEVAAEAAVEAIAEVAVEIAVEAIVEAVESAPEVVETPAAETPSTDEG